MFSDPAAAGRRSAELSGRVGNTQWGRSMLGSKGGNPNISTAHEARRLKAAQRRLETQILQRERGWAAATAAELDAHARLTRGQANPAGHPEADLPIDYEAQIDQLRRDGRKRAR